MPVNFKQQSHKSQKTKKIKKRVKNTPSTNTLQMILGLPNIVNITFKERTINIWLYRIGDGINFNNSKEHNIFSCSKSCKSNYPFIKNVKRGDILLFIPNESKGKVTHVSTFKCIKERTAYTMTNEELGWDNSKNWYDHYEVHYTNLYDLSCVEPAVYIPIKGQNPIRLYDESYYNINLIQVLKQVKRFCKVKKYPNVTF
tara:strand:- start:295 stop:894 length:600 start_codon:yes stop_codon:yes gene_type:complete